MVARVIPPPGTYREAMASAYNLMREAAQFEGPALAAFRDAEFKCEDLGLSLARKHDLDVSGAKYISRTTKPTSDEQIASCRALAIADGKYQHARADKLHWERVWRGWADFLEAHPHMADTQLKFRGEWRALLVKEARR